MPIRTGWLVPNQVILSQGLGDIRPGELEVFLEDMRGLVQEANGTLHVVQDMRYLGRPDMDLGKVRKFLGVARSITGFYVIYGQPGNHIMGFLYQASAKILGIRSHQPFATYEDMCRFLMEQDPNLTMPDAAVDFFTETEVASYLSEAK